MDLVCPDIRRHINERKYLKNKKKNFYLLVKA